jgi:hypothetical protein
MINWVQKATGRCGRTGKYDLTIAINKASRGRKSYAFTLRNGIEKKVDPNNYGMLQFGFDSVYENRLYFRPVPIGGYTVGNSGKKNKRMQIDAQVIDAALDGQQEMPIGNFNAKFDNDNRLYYFEIFQERG